MILSSGAAFVRFVHRIVPIAVALAALGVHAQVRRAEEPAATISPILQGLRSFRTVATVLHVGAHPDDENTQLITYLSRGRGYRAAYLSVTRGDGGQNLLGPEFDEKLGVARTQELLAARRLDGGQQFFTRAIDFGFSKNPEETLRLWDHQQVLADVVRIYRTFRPDVVVTRFPIPPGSGGHGHHTASAILAVEAFKLSGDPKAFPEQLAEGLTPWQPKRIFWNGFGGGRGGGGLKGPTIEVDIGGKDPVTGESFAAIAGRSRAMHKTQGMGGFGGGGGGGPRPESFMLLGGEPATNDLMDGIDTTWSREPGGAEIGSMADEAIAQFNPADAAASVPMLLAIRSRLAALPADPVIDDKRGQLDRILRECIGLVATTDIARCEVVPGEEFHLEHHVALSSTAVPVRWIAVRYPSLHRETKVDAALGSAQPLAREATLTLPASTPISQPYWLRGERGNGIFHVDDPRLIGRPVDPAVVPVEFVFEIGGQQMIVADEPLQRSGVGRPETARRLVAIPPVALHFVSGVSVFRPGQTRPVTVEATAARDGIEGSVQLAAGAGWKIEPRSQRIALQKSGNAAKVVFSVTAPSEPSRAQVGATAEVGGRHFDNERIEIHYAHIPLQLLQPVASAKLVAVDVATRGHRVGYLPGAGDDTAESLRQLGYDVVGLTGNDLVPERLRELDAIVIGVRAFNTRTDLVAHLPALFGYVRDGGTVVAQYNRPGRDLKTTALAPYPITLSDERVTDETAPVAFLAPDNPVLNTPNKITAADFDGWVQERGVYFPSRWDEHFTPILSAGDPGEEKLKSGLLVAQDGKGYFVYTGLAFFRQLPAGVPGAYRLFANLVSLGK